MKHLKDLDLFLEQHNIYFKMVNKIIKAFVPLNNPKFDRCFCVVTNQPEFLPMVFDAGIQGLLFDSVGKIKKLSLMRRWEFVLEWAFPKTDDELNDFIQWGIRLIAHLATFGREVFAAYGRLPGG